MESQKRWTKDRALFVAIMVICIIVYGWAAAKSVLTDRQFNTTYYLDFG